MQVYHSLNDFNVTNTAVTIGVFDGVHLGHRSVINHVVSIAKKESLESVVFSFWPHPRLVFDNSEASLELLNTLNEKIELFKTTGIDHLILFPFNLAFSKLSSSEFIEEILVKQLKIKKLVIGFNHHFGHDRKGDITELKKLASKHSFSVQKLDEINLGKSEVSSTKIRNLLSGGEIEKANQFLGYHYFIAGQVVKGLNIGKEIGFPTANVRVPETFKLIPQNGVYAVFVDYNGKKYMGMLNIGVRPTISERSQDLSIEVNIFDFDQEIYDENITIRFVRKIRNEIKFNNRNELQGQLKKDKIKALEYLSI